MVIAASQASGTDKPSDISGTNGIFCSKGKPHLKRKLCNPVRIESGDFQMTRPARMARCLMEELAEHSEAHAIVCRLIRNMQYDYRRVVEELILTEAELIAHHRETFENSLDLLLITSGATLRAADASDLVAVFGWCSVMRDLDDDLDNGLINIPATVVSEARNAGVEQLQLSELGAVTRFRNWLAREHQLAVTRLERFEDKLESSRDQPGCAVFRLFHRSIKHYANHRYPRQFKGVLGAEVPLNV
jgi:hypothetical protein